MGFGYLSITPKHPPAYYVENTNDVDILRMLEQLFGKFPIEMDSNALPVLKAAKLRWDEVKYKRDINFINKLINAIKKYSQIIVDYSEPRC